MTRRFWDDEFGKYAPQYRLEVTAPILNKAGQFTTSPNLRLILGQTSPRFSLAYAMDHRQIVIANLAKGTIGEQATNVLGSLLVSHIQLTAIARSSIPPERRVPHFIHVDEFQSFTTDAFASIFSEARKFAAYSLMEVRLKAKNEADDELKLKVTERDQQITSMQRQIEELKRKAEQGSQQLQGEVLELEVEAMLQLNFPMDGIEPVAKGEFGGDVLQRVFSPAGQVCGAILWESKRTKHWSDGWLAKLRGEPAPVCE